jgi:hypothetical protein
VGSLSRVTRRVVGTGCGHRWVLVGFLSPNSRMKAVDAVDSEHVSTCWSHPSGTTVPGRALGVLSEPLRARRDKPLDPPTHGSRHRPVPAALPRAAGSGDAHARRRDPGEPADAEPRNRRVLRRMESIL